MSKQEKMYTIELTEHELARVLFVMNMVNGKIYGSNIAWLAFDKLNLKQVGASAVRSKIEELSRTANLPILINYYPIQKEWETFLGIGIGEEKKALLRKIANMEKELTELKEML